MTFREMLRTTTFGLAKRFLRSQTKLHVHSMRAMSSETGDVIVEKVGNKGVITLDRPKALNALSLDMIRQIYPTLKKWDTDPDMKMVIIKAKKDSKAFCAGGDVKAIAETKGQDSNLRDVFFREEYRLNNLIASLTIPYVALLDGVTMGGLENLEGDLMRLTTPNISDIDKILLKHQDQCEADFRKEFGLKKFMGRINSAFNAPSVEAIVENLSKDTSEWAQEQVKILQKMSPLSMKITFRELQEGSILTLQDALKMEFRLSQRFMQDSDFYEGVGAVLINRSGEPKWNPATLAEVTEEKVDSYFEPLPADKELRL